MPESDDPQPVGHLPWRSRRLWWGPAATLLLLLLVELVTHGPARLPAPLPAALFLGALGGIVLAAFTGGLRAALVAIALFTLYTPRFLVNEPGELVDLSRAGLTSTAVVFGIALAIGLPTSYLKRRDDRLARRALAAERVARASAEKRGSELAATNQVLLDFAHVASHDLKEPVRGMELYLRVLEEDEAHRLSDEGRRVLASAVDAQARLASLVQTLLDYARATRLDPADLRAVDVGETVASADCRVRYESAVRDRGARLELPPPHLAPRVLVTPVALSLVMGNLIANAAQHNPRPTPRIRVRAGASAKPGMVEVTVEDDGPGFSEENLRRVRASLLGREGGGAGRSGFGLVMVHRAVERLGGTVSMETSPLGGALIRLRLPSAAAERPTAVRVETPPLDDAAAARSAASEGRARGA